MSDSQPRYDIKRLRLEQRRARHLAEVFLLEEIISLTESRLSTEEIRHWAENRLRISRDEVGRD